MAQHEPARTVSHPPTEDLKLSLVYYHKVLKLLICGQR